MHDNTELRGQALLDIQDVISMTSLSKASIYRRIREKRFPEPIPLLPDGRRVAWKRSDVECWLEAPLEWGAEAEF